MGEHNTATHRASRTQVHVGSEAASALSHLCTREPAPRRSVRRAEHWSDRRPISSLHCLAWQQTRPSSSVAEAVFTRTVAEQPSGFEQPQASFTHAACRRAGPVRLGPRRGNSLRRRDRRASSQNEMRPMLSPQREPRRARASTSRGNSQSSRFDVSHAVNAIDSSDAVTRRESRWCRNYLRPRGVFHLGLMCTCSTSRKRPMCAQWSSVSLPA